MLAAAYVGVWRVATYAEYKELIETAHGGTKKFSSKTNFAKMYITPFPLRAMVVYDNVPDVGVLYDDAICKLININEDPEIRDKVLLRKELRCLNEKLNEKLSSSSQSNAGKRETWIIRRTRAPRTRKSPRNKCWC